MLARSSSDPVILGASLPLELILRKFRLNNGNLNPHRVMAAAPATASGGAP
jgi:hypothetical protein